MLEVIAYPPPRRWWQFWIPRRPYLLRDGVEYRVDPSGEEVEVFRPRPRYAYKVAYVRT